MKRKSGFRAARLLRRLALALAGVLLGVNLYLANARGLLGDQLPMPFGVGAAVVLSGSMEPTLQIGDLVIVREGADYGVGRIVVFQSEGSLVVHRVVEMDGDTIVTRGDANNADDQPISTADVKGVMAARIPKVGSVLLRLRTPTAMIVMLALALVFSEASFRRDKEGDAKETEEIKAEIERLRALSAQEREDRETQEGGDAP